MHQESMTGPDWLSDRDKKRAERAKEKKQKSGMACAKKCLAAADAISAYMSACREAGDGSGVTRSDDQRLLFIRDLRDYVAFLEMRHARD